MSMYNICYQAIVVFAVVVCLTRHVLVSCSVTTEKEHQKTILTWLLF